MWECKGLIKVTLNDDVFTISIHSRTGDFGDRFKPSVTIVMICTSNHLTFLVNKFHSFNPRETAYVTLFIVSGYKKQLHWVLISWTNV